MFWTGEDERVGKLQTEFGDQLDVIYTTNDGTFGVKGFVTTPLQAMLEPTRVLEGPHVAEVIAIGPPLMMRAVSDLTKPTSVPTVVSLNSIMVDATGMCGACMVPVIIDGKMVRKHACIDGPELDAHIIDWDKFLPRFDQFKAQEAAAGPATGGDPVDPPVPSAPVGAAVDPRPSGSSAPGCGAAASVAGVPRRPVAHLLVVAGQVSPHAADVVLR